MATLELINASYRYKQNLPDVLQNMSVSFERGKITAISGNSGSGKTTLLMLLAGLDYRYRGRIEYNGNDLKSVDQNVYRAKSIGIVFQNYNLLSNATPLDNVMMGLFLANETTSLQAKAKDLLRIVGITDEKHNRKCLHLSGGEQQRVAIARALTGEPSVIIADEPTANLDESNFNIIMKIFSDLAKKEGKTIIIATHSSVVAKYADNMLRLEEINQRN